MSCTSLGLDWAAARGSGVAAATRRTSASRTRRKGGLDSRVASTRAPRKHLGLRRGRRFLGLLRPPATPTLPPEQEEAEQHEEQQEEGDHRRDALVRVVDVERLRRLTGV